MEYARVFKDSIHLFTGRLGTAIIGLVDMMLLARILTTEQMGKYSLFLMIVNLALIIGLNWSDSSIIRHGREEYVTRKKINKSFWARMYLFIPILLAFVVIFIIFSKQLTEYIGIDSKLIYLLIIMFVFTGLLNFINYIYQSTDRMKKSAYVLLSQKVFYMICLLTAFLGIFKANLTIVLILINLSFLLAIILNILTFDYDKILPYKFSKKYFKKIWTYSWPQLIGFPGLYVINYVDIFVIKKYMTLTDVGVYNMAYSLFMNITVFILIIHTVFLPLIIEYRTKRKYGMIRKYIKKIPVFSLVWVGIVLLGIFISKYLIPIILSDKYSGSIVSFNILLIASIFYFISICFLPLINAFDLIIYSQIINIIKAFTNIVMDIILVPKIGIIGAAYGTLISYFVGMVLVILLIALNKKKILYGLESNRKK